MGRKAKGADKVEPPKPVMVESMKRHLGSMLGMAGFDPTARDEFKYKGGFYCPMCGSQELVQHSYDCEAAKFAKDAGVTLSEYAKSPWLWCDKVSTYDEGEVRCFKNPHHTMMHGFPTRRTCIEAQVALGATAVGSKQPKKYIPQEAVDMATEKNGKAAKAKGKAGKDNTKALKKAQEANEGKRAELHAKKIHLLTKENPKREGTEAHKRFAKYKNGMTVSDALAAGITMSDIRYNEEHGHLELK